MSKISSNTVKAIAGYKLTARVTSSLSMISNAKMKAQKFNPNKWRRTAER